MCDGVTHYEQSVLNTRTNLINFLDELKEENAKMTAITHEEMLGVSA